MVQKEQVKLMIFVIFHTYRNNKLKLLSNVDTKKKKHIASHTTFVKSVLLGAPEPSTLKDLFYVKKNLS